MSIRMSFASIPIAAAFSFQAVADLLQEGRAPLINGQIQEVSREISTDDGPQARVAFVSGLPTARTIRLQLNHVPGSNIQPDVAAIVFDAGNQEVSRYSAQQLAKEGWVWTPPIEGTSARVELDGSPGAGAEFRVRIKAIASHVPPRQPTLNQVRQFDWETIQYIQAQQPEIFEATRPVAIISFVINEGPAVCTGFMVSETQMLTNYHCFHTGEICKSAAVIFGFHNSDEPLGKEKQDCLRIVKQDKELDATLIEVAASPGTRWGFLALSDVEAVAGEPTVVPQHAGGYPKTVVRKDCVVSTIPADGVIPGADFGHSCDTMDGSSGSPVLRRADLKVVGLHHWGFDSKHEHWKAENRAIRISLIKERFGL